MTNYEYMATQNALVSVRAMLTTLDLSAFIAMIDKAEAWGPTLDPTLYRKAAAELRKVRELALAAAELQGCALPEYATMAADSEADSEAGSDAPLLPQCPGCMTARDVGGKCRLHAGGPLDGSTRLVDVGSMQIDVGSMQMGEPVVERCDFMVLGVRCERAQGHPADEPHSASTESVIAAMSQRSREFEALRAAAETFSAGQSSLAGIEKELER